MRQFGRRGHRRCAGVARDDDGAAGVGDAGGAEKILAAQKAAHQAGGEGVAGAEHVEHFDALADRGRRVFQPRGHRAVDEAAALGAELDHQRRAAHLAHAAQASQQVAGHAAGDHELLLGADQQIELRQHLLQPGGDRRVGDIAVGAFAALGQAPQHRPVVDVEHAHHAVPSGVAERGERGRAHRRRRQVRAGDQQRAAAGDEVLADRRGVDGHVGAVLAHEQQREGVAVLQAQQHQAGQALGVDLHLAGVATLALQRLEQEAPHLLVADTRDHRRAQAQPGHAEGDVGRAAAEVLGKTGDILQPRADLLGVEVDGQATEAGQVEAAGPGKSQTAHAKTPSSRNGGATSWSPASAPARSSAGRTPSAPCRMVARIGPSAVRPCWISPSATNLAAAAASAACACGARSSAWLRSSMQRRDAMAQEEFEVRTPDLSKDGAADRREGEARRGHVTVPRHADRICHEHQFPLHLWGQRSVHRLLAEWRNSPVPARPATARLRVTPCPRH